MTDEQARERLRLAWRELCAALGVAYMLSPDGHAITCGRCGMTSHNLLDVENRYCANCRVLHEDRK
jgi:protein-arginine kinase activator protein McsA